MYDIIIIGGGASGLFATALALRRGMTALLIEAQDRVGKKLLSTGNGKCNLSNERITIESYNTPKVESIIERYPAERIVKEFHRLGLYTRSVDGRIYPYSEQASSALNALRDNIVGATILESTLATKITPQTDGYKVSTSSGDYTARKVCVACGSAATSGKNSYGLLQELGYKAVDCRPSLLPILVKDDSIKGMQGVRAQVSATLIISGKAVFTERGEMLFKEKALSGIVSFGLSARLARAQANECVVAIDFAPELSHDELVEIIGSVGLDNMFHKSIVANIRNNVKNTTNIKNANNVNNTQELARVIKDYRVNCIRNTDGKQAQVMCGGVSLDEFDIQTMQSTRHKGLYAIGEVVDVDGDCGGYNLHWAWASALAMIENMR